MAQVEDYRKLYKQFEARFQLKKAVAHTSSIAVAGGV